MNNDFGKVYDAGFKAYLAQSPNKDKIELRHRDDRGAAPTVTDPMTTLAAKNPDVFIAMLAGTPCTQTVTEAAQNGMKATAKYLFAASLCGNDASMGKDKVGGDGSSPRRLVAGQRRRPRHRPTLRRPSCPTSSSRSTR